VGSFFGGVVNSTVTVMDLARRVEDTGHRFAGLAFRSVALATGAMLLRNTVLLVIISPSTALAAAGPLVLMTATAFLVALLRRGKDTADQSAGEAVAARLRSPFSLQAALVFGLIFLALQVLGTLAARALGQPGFYAVSAIGGLVSSASAVASAGSLAARGRLDPTVAAVGAVLACITSAVIHLPIVARAADDRRLTRQVSAVLTAVTLAGALGVGVQLLITRLAL